MVCQECGSKPATLHFTKIVNGEKTEFHICEACAREKGDFIPGVPNSFSIHNLLSGLMNFEPVSEDGKVTGKERQPLQCENCGLTYAQFSKLGRFGCSSCYKYFADSLDPIFKRVHGNTVHVGKIPKRAGGMVRYKREADQLRKKLQTLVENEEFEQAAEIRDRIRELERKVSGE